MCLLLLLKGRSNPIDFQRLQTIVAKPARTPSTFLRVMMFYLSSPKISASQKTTSYDHYLRSCKTAFTCGDHPDTTTDVRLPQSTVEDRRQSRDHQQSFH